VVERVTRNSFGCMMIKAAIPAKEKYRKTRRKPVMKAPQSALDFSLVLMLDDDVENFMIVLFNKLRERVGFLSSNFSPSPSQLP
jgi:hypothetical protein